MKILEYQTKQLFDKHGIPVPLGGVASTPDEAVNIARSLGGQKWVIKAQIHAGARGAGHFADTDDSQGGVRFAASVEDVRRNAGQMLGHVLVTEQTGPAGSDVTRVYVEEVHEVKRELYLALVVDRRTSRVTFLASTEGGVDIESVAQRSPDAVSKTAIDPVEGLRPEIARDVASGLGLSAEQASAAERIMKAMYEMFIGLDASLIEINPLAVTTEGQLLALDGTLTFDDNALFRHRDIQALRDEGELQSGELDAYRHGLNYVKMDGNIGCLASGAGLALATLDAVKAYGGEPANFLDVPPVVETDRVKYALRLILADPSVRAVLVNVFGGGIMRCDTIADAIVHANKETPIEVPLVVRLAGVNDEFARYRIEASGLKVIFADNMAEAAQKAVTAASEAKIAERRGWWQKVRDVLGIEDEAGSRTGH